MIDAAVTDGVTLLVSSVRMRCSSRPIVLGFGGRSASGGPVVGSSRLFGASRPRPAFYSPEGCPRRSVTAIRWLVSGWRRTLRDYRLSFCASPGGRRSVAGCLRPWHYRYVVCRCSGVIFRARRLLRRFIGVRCGTRLLVRTKPQG